MMNVAARSIVAAMISTIVFCLASAQAATYALRGTLITPNDTIEDGMLTVQGEKIVQIGRGGPISAGTGVFKVDGVILPGMIDLHDHITWNVFPRWKPGREFANRYEWQETPRTERS